MNKLQEKLDILLKLSQSDALKFMYCTTTSSHSFIEQYVVISPSPGIYRLIDSNENKLIGILTEGYLSTSPGVIEIDYENFTVIFSHDNCIIRCYEPDDYWHTEPYDTFLKNKEDFFNLMLVQNIPISYNDYEDLLLYSPEFNKHVKIYMID